MGLVAYALGALAVFGAFSRPRRPITPEEFASDYGYAPAHFTGAGDDYTLSDEDVRAYLRYLDAFGTAQVLPHAQREALETRVFALQGQLAQELQALQNSAGISPGKYANGGSL